MNVPGLNAYLVLFFILIILNCLPILVWAQNQASNAPPMLATNLTVQPITPAVGVANPVSPIDLSTVLRLAHAQNLDIQIAREQLREAQANHASALEQFFPWLSPGVSYRRHENRIQDIGGSIFDVSKQSYAPGAVVAAQMDLGDAIYKNLAAKQLERAAGHNLSTQDQDSTLGAAQGYFDLAKAKAVVRVFQEALNISQDYQRQIHDAVGAGIAFKGDELRVQVQTERYQIAVRQSLEQQRVAAARLAQVLHLDSAVELVPDEAELVPLTLVATNTSLDALVQQALRTRPELMRSRSLVEAAREGKNNAIYGPLIPSLGAQGFMGGLGGGKDSQTGSFGASEDYLVGLSWRIGPGGLFDKARVQASKARLEAAHLSQAQVRDEITRQVVENNTRVQSLFDQLATASHNLVTTADTLRLTRQRKQYGVGVVLEDIQAQQELARARSDYLSVVAEYNKAQYALRKAIGDLPAIPARK